MIPFSVTMNKVNQQQQLIVNFPFAAHLFFFVRKDKRLNRGALFSPSVNG